MRANVTEMEKLLKNGNRQMLVDYLMTHSAETRDEAAFRIKLMDKELELRDKE